jgi:hypothetical protein
VRGGQVRADDDVCSISPLRLQKAQIIYRDEDRLALCVSAELKSSNSPFDFEGSASDYHHGVLFRCGSQLFDYFRVLEPH